VSSFSIHFGSISFGFILIIENFILYGEKRLGYKGFWAFVSSWVLCMLWVSPNVKKFDVLGLYLFRKRWTGKDLCVARYRIYRHSFILISDKAVWTAKKGISVYAKNLYAVVLLLV